MAVVMTAAFLRIARLMKRLLKKIHLYLSFIAAFFILGISLSGALLLFAPEIEQYLQPKNALPELSKLSSVVY